MWGQPPAQEVSKLQVCLELAGHALCLPCIHTLSVSIRFGCYQRQDTRLNESLV